jgi:CheY-like chemotaxis protein
LQIFRDALEAAGATVRAVSSATEAIRESERSWPDLLVTDLGLPGVDGFELLQTLRSSRQTRGIPAVAVTAYASPDDRLRTLAAGFQAHVSKPIDPVALVSALAAALSAID